MAIMPGADTSRMLTAFRAALRSPRCVVLHVAVTEAPYPNYAAGLGAHFYVRKDGWCLQQIDTAYRGGHAYQGNASLIGIETQGGVTNPQGEPWTAAQVEALARILAWTSAAHGVPLVPMANSRPASRGVGYHRQGCDGNYDPAHPGRVANGERWSTSRSKICPGNAKIDQIPAILARATVLAAGGTPAPAATPAPAPAPAGPLAADGWLGPATVSRWQQVLGTAVDGQICRPSSTLVRRVQELLNAAGCLGHNGLALAVDGKGIYPNVSGRTPRTQTVAALQRYLGTDADGVLDAPSAAVAALQHRLNAGRF